MSTPPRVRRLIMFKHGVAYLERGGPVEGPFELAFRREEMNDVLKSLAVWVSRGDGTVGAVSFESPEDPDEALRERGLLFEKGAAFRDLVHALRGRLVEVKAGSEPQRGEVLGLESVLDNEARHRQRLVLRTADDRVELIDVELLRQIQLADGATRSDVSWLIEKSRAARSREHRTVQVALDGRPEDLRVAYTIPAPVWRVSYRIVTEDDDTTVMAWAIVHNPAEEDLDQVDLTLTTGQPVSFVIDLYQPRHVQRAVVQESERAVAAPRQYQQARPGAPPPAPRAKMKAAGRAAGFAPPPQGAAAPAPAMGGVPMEAALTDVLEQASDTGERSEFFEYRVRTPISIKRDGSAMVPLAGSKVRAHRERLWRDGQGAHPDIVLRFDNDTDLVLEEGPAVVYDEGAYAGEAMVPFTARGAEVRLAFARDLAIRCARKTDAQRYLMGLKMGNAMAIESHERRLRHLLRLENDHASAMEVIVEIPRTPTHDLGPEGLEPFEKTASFWRFKVAVPAGESVETEVDERWRESLRVDMSSLTTSRFKNWLDGQYLDAAMEGALRGVFATWEEAKTLDRRAEELGRQLAALIDRRDGLTSQLQVLREGGDEGALRVQYARELRDSQTRHDELLAEIQSLRERAEQTRQRAHQTLAGLSSD